MGLKLKSLSLEVIESVENQISVYKHCRKTGQASKRAARYASHLIEADVAADTSSMDEQAE